MKHCTMISHDGNGKLYKTRVFELCSGLYLLPNYHSTDKCYYYDVIVETKFDLHGHYIVAGDNTVPAVFTWCGFPASHLREKLCHISKASYHEQLHKYGRIIKLKSV